MEKKNFRHQPVGARDHLDADSASNQAPTPMEMLLMALGACTAVDVVNILQKKRQKLESLEVLCSGRARSGPAESLDQAGNCISPAGPARRSGGQARHRTERRKVLLGVGDAAKNRNVELAPRDFSLLRSDLSLSPLAASHRIHCFLCTKERFKEHHVHRIAAKVTGIAGYVPPKV